MHEFGRYAIVVAHPDDEVLWMSSLVAKAEKVVIYFGHIPSRPALSEGRRAAVAALPHPRIEFLDLSETEVFSTAQWPEPAETPFGLATKRRRYSMAGYDEARYRDNYRCLVQQFGATLKGFDSAVTHNSWGEYGHEEHVQVFRAVEATSRELGFAVWVSCFVSNESLQRMWRNLRRVGTQTPCCRPMPPPTPRFATSTTARGSGPGRPPIRCRPAKCSIACAAWRRATRWIRPGT